jgi:hypothetical protein
MKQLLKEFDFVERDHLLLNQIKTVLLAPIPGKNTGPFSVEVSLMVVI